MNKKSIGRLLFVVLLLAGTQLVAAEKPNFVIVLADDVSWSSFGCNNPGLQTRTPNIDQLARQGLRFTNFYCGVAQCGPVRHELYTGLLPSNSGVMADGGPYNQPKAEFKNVINYLGDLGYDVGLSGKGHFNKPNKFKQFGGFPSYCQQKESKWDESMEGSRKFINEALSAKKPFCMFICSIHAHSPWNDGDASNFPQDTLTLPPHFVDGPKTREVMARYGAEVEELDKQVGATMKVLADMKLEKNTVLIFLSEMPKRRSST